MSLDIVPYQQDAVPAVREFNRRMAAAGFSADHEQFPETPDPGWMPSLELFLAFEESMVRGGYILRRQNFSVRGDTATAAHYRLPLSEGVIDRSYAMLGLRLVRDALAREPRLYAMGMGGWDKPLPQMLKRLKWGMCAVPLYFKVVHPARFLRNIRALRTSPVRRAALDAAAFTGAGWLGMKALGLTRRLPSEPFDPRPLLRPVGGQNLGTLAPRLRPAGPARRCHAGSTLSAFRPALPPRARGRRMGRRAGHPDEKPQAVRRHARRHHRGLPGPAGIRPIRHPCRRRPARSSAASI